MIKLILMALLVSNTTQASFVEFDFTEDSSNLKSYESVPTEFIEITEEFKLLFEPEVLALGGNLEVEFDMENGTANAHATREGDIWKIVFMGGMIRNKRLNGDIYTAILCHELGHHLAGAPLKFPDSPENAWISAEGQADYFATNICLKKMYQYKDNAAYLAQNPASDFIKTACKNKDVNHYDLCLRNSIIAEQTGVFIAKLNRRGMGGRKPIPKIDKFDQTVRTTTFTTHPKPQCRMDTYFQGALCEQFYIGELTKPNCSNLYEDSFFGARPRCWYAPVNTDPFME